jgi:hypothetical protein
MKNAGSDSRLIFKVLKEGILFLYDIYRTCDFLKNTCRRNTAHASAMLIRTSCLTLDGRFEIDCMSPNASPAQTVDASLRRKNTESGTTGHRGNMQRSSARCNQSG